MQLIFVFVPLIAFLYASVGFGGATGYLAIMQLFGVDPRVMASTALVLNIVVAGISFLSYSRAGHLRRDLLLPFIITSNPAAFIGGSFKLTNQVYSILLYSCSPLSPCACCFLAKAIELSQPAGSCPSGWRPLLAW